MYERSCINRLWLGENNVEWFKHFSSDRTRRLAVFVTGNIIFVWPKVTKQLISVSVTSWSPLSRRPVLTRQTRNLHITHHGKSLVILKEEFMFPHLFFLREDFSNSSAKKMFEQKKMVIGNLGHILHNILCKFFVCTW